MLFAVGLCALVSLAAGCTKELPYGGREDNKNKHEDDSTKVHFADVVALGQIKKNVSGNYPYSSKEGIYTVEFDVQCYYKGGPIPETIYIAGMGKFL